MSRSIISQASASLVSELNFETVDSDSHNPKTKNNFNDLSPPGRDHKRRRDTRRSRFRTISI